MSETFVRSEKLNGIVFDVKLRIPEWKVLFAVDGNSSVDDIAGFLSMDTNTVSEVLNKLQGLELVSHKNGSADFAADPAIAQTHKLFEEASEEDIAEVADEEATLTDFEPVPEAEVEEEDTPGDDVAAEEAAEPAQEDGDDAEENVEQADETPEETFVMDDPEDLVSDTVILDNPEDLLTEDSDEVEDSVDNEDDFDQLIGNLLEDDEESSDSLPDTEVEAPPAPPGEQTEDFDLGSIFEEEMTETGEALDEMLGDLDDEATVADTIPDAEVGVPEADAGVVVSGETILVVDDSVVIRKMVEIALENESYNIVSVATGKEALTYLDDKKPNLIILDIMLSDVNGLDVLKAIKASKSDIPVVMLSAKDTPRETTKAKQLGADDFIPKPFKDEELVSKIKELIRT